ncbi:hypothetical protein [Streptomyces sp. SD15]
MSIACVLDLVTAFDPGSLSGSVSGELSDGLSDELADERINRYSAALAALPADRPHRYAYVAVLAALTGLRARDLRETAPSRADVLAMNARELTEAAAADAPADFLPLGLLRRGSFDGALPVAAVSVLTTVTDATEPTSSTGEPADPERDALAEDLARTVAQLTRMDDVRLDDPEHLDSSIEIMRELLADIGEDDPATRGLIAGALGSALSSRSSAQGTEAAYVHAGT